MTSATVFGRGVRRFLCKAFAVSIASLYVTRVNHLMRRHVFAILLGGLGDLFGTRYFSLRNCLSLRNGGKREVRRRGRGCTYRGAPIASTGA